MGHFLLEIEDFSPKCSHFIAFWDKERMIRERFRELSLILIERKKTFFLYIFLSLKEICTTTSCCAYIEHIFDMFLQRRQSLLCIRISFAYSYAHNQRLCAYKDKDLRSLSSK